MTDQDENRPLSRREIRLREMAAAGVSDPAAADPAPAAAEATAFAEAAAEPAFEVEISPFDEDGRQRSRREMRELREQAIAEMQAAAGIPAEPEPEVPAAVEAEVAGSPFSFDALLQDAAAEEAAADASSADEAEVSATEDVAPVAAAPETVAAEAAGAGEQAVDTHAMPSALAQEWANVHAANEAAAAAEAAADSLTPPEAVAPDQHEPSLVAGVAAVAAEPVVDPAAVPEAPAGAEAHDDVESQAASVAEATTTFDGETAPEVAFIAHPADDAPPVVAASPEGDPALEQPQQADSFTSPVSASSAPVSQGYSFPDIAPLDEGQSVFDDPSVRMMGAGQRQAAEQGESREFDDLISRAVAQEGAASSTNTSALILPSMPDSDGLTGPLGETGELFITGSFDLPKSLSETGGHASLHDAGDVESLDEFGFVEATPTGMMAPVSASRAVSARGVQGPVVAEATKDKSKLPVVLIATGGVLVLGAVGLIIWAAASGLFG